MARSKKEIDKELMYKKIMPTASIIDNSDIGNAEHEFGNILQVPLPMKPIEVHIPEAEPVNIMERLLEGRLDAAIEKFHCCTCDKCRKAITALTLNKLPACYVDTQDADKLQQAESQYAGQVATALVQAILNVKSHPTH